MVTVFDFSYCHPLVAVRQCRSAVLPIMAFQNRENDFMRYSSSRRALLRAAGCAPIALAFKAHAAKDAHSRAALADLATLEKTSGGRLGVYALDTGNGVEIRQRADERFPLCSTFKLVLASAVLAKSVEAPHLMEQRIRYAASDLLDYAPTARQHLSEGMSVAALCRATVELSDNTAANLLIKMLGGPSAVTAYARSIGDHEFRLDRWETELNTAIPGDLRDTSTPAAMARTTRAVALGDALPASQRQTLQTWLRNCQTGAKRIRAAVPAGWEVGDKTGTGHYGSTNDTGVIWPPSRKPIALAIYYTQQHADAKTRDDVVAAAARIVIDSFAKNSGRST